MLPYSSNAQGVFKGFKFEFSDFEMCFEEHLREYQKLVLTHFLKKIVLRLSRTQPTISHNLINIFLYRKALEPNIILVDYIVKCTIIL